MTTLDLVPWASSVVSEAVRLRPLVHGKRRITRARGLCVLLGMSEYRTDIHYHRRIQREAMSTKVSPVRDEEGDGYALEGRYAIHIREADLTGNEVPYQKAGDRRDRIGRIARSMCPFDPPHEREPLRFDL